MAKAPVKTKGAAKAAPEGQEFLVIATKKGYLRDLRVVGDKFMVTEEQFTETWMEKA